MGIYYYIFPSRASQIAKRHSHIKFSTVEVEYNYRSFKSGGNETCHLSLRNQK